MIPNLIRVSWLFDLQVSGEVQDHAQFDIHFFSDTIPPTTPGKQDQLDVLAQAGADHWSSDVSHTPFSHAAIENSVKAAWLDSSGHTIAESVKAPATGWQGNNAYESLPWSSTLVVSLYAYQRGTFTTEARNKRGRIYLPPLNRFLFSNTDSGQPGLGDCEDIRDHVGTMLSAMASTDLGSGAMAGPVIYSTVKDYYSNLSYLSVDNKVDTQRRRERQQSSSISTVAWTP